MFQNQGKFIKLKSHLCKMSSQSNKRGIKQFLLFFKIPESFSFSNATATDMILFSDVNNIQ